MEDLPDSEDLPKNETELIAATKRLIALMTDNPKFANAPVSVDELRRQLDAFIKARNAEDVAGSRCGDTGQSGRRQSSERAA